MAFDAKDPETVAAIKASVEEAILGLQAKNTELLAKLKKAQKDSVIDPAEHTALQAELDATQAKLTEAVKGQKAAVTEADKVKKAYESESQLTHRLLVENGLTEALTKAGVTNPVHLKAAKALLSSQVTLATEGENRVAKIGDKLLPDSVGEWAKGEEGKYFVAAPANGGGGATGGGRGQGETGAKVMTRDAFDSMKDENARMKFFLDGGKLVDAA
jgi:hypothetical protein